MDQQQPNEVQQISIKQRIINIHENFENIRGSIFDEFSQIPPKSSVLLFLGKFQNKFHSFYKDFENKQFILDRNYFKLIKIENKGKTSYLLYLPQILLYDDQNNEIAQNLCISKIYAEMALKKMETCQFYLILDIQQLRGDDVRGWLDNVCIDSIFFFGTYFFNENNFFLLRYLQEDKWDQYQFSKSSGIFSYFSQNQQLKNQIYSKNEVLEAIFKSDNYTYVKTVQSEDAINYGKMMSYLSKELNPLKEQINEDLKQFQMVLLRLQQMPIIKNNFEVVQEIGKYLNDLQKGFMNEKNLLTDNASQIFEVYEFINKVNQEQNAQNINNRQKIRQKNSQSHQMKNFKEEVKIQELIVQPLLCDEAINKLKGIIQFFQKYHNNIFKNEKICEVQKLILNLKQWCANCNDTLENTLYNITSRIQDGPKNEIENGIYFIGITKVGKSTIINSLLNPDNIIQDHFVSQKCYGINTETKFAIGKGGVSETQHINGVYIGKREELNQIFDQNEKNVFSIEEILDQEQIQKCKIPKKYFVFDCPGFDDNINELMRIAHRISLYNYFKNTKNIIVFFVIDISQQSIEQVKNTFDPITQILREKNDLVTHFDKWTNIILTKAKKGQRQYYLDNWQQVYKGYLDENYSFYKKLFENRCVEFEKPKTQDIEQIIQSLTNQIIKMSSSQLQSNQAFTPKFQGVLDPKVQSLYEHCIPKVKQKLESILNFFLEDLDEYILESSDNLEIKKEKFEKIQSILLDQNTKQMINLITYNNCEIILKELSNWVNGNPYLQKNDIFIQQYIEDMKSILKISKYCQKIKKIAPFEIKIDNLVKKIKIVITKIDEVRSWYLLNDQRKNLHLRKNYLAELHKQKQQLEQINQFQFNLLQSQYQAQG
ncbi:unnamed protein product (macronuclear) [Paramecium tetraurelia]|uniref:G domain-containing protein n=1 Tax=Paramecium tetraurelia TaxID=5888 RepID=A0DWC6_PARTE|nr:uncharacterized protein GSPATT00020985001 [Paramecium tetraurelia]CAK87343.1 unnamed protein product [Paramecium tetraurelia]|eukprot:XP_001454740.1 hypothetical protein (macronuclear) [Paramecium tetraurelia strain d4-2]